MLDTPLKMHRHRKGPAITAQFYAHNNKLTEIALYTHSENGIYWQMVANHPYPELETLLDEWIYAYCNRQKNQLPLSLKGVTDFTADVLNVISKIPFGKTMTYGDIAKKIGKPEASRAVGGACGRNPFPLIIPCHRVLAAGNKLGGFSLDLVVKRRLLDFEGVHFD